MRLIYNEFNQLRRPWLVATEIYGYLTFRDEFGRSKKFCRRCRPVKTSTDPMAVHSKNGRCPAS